MFFFIEHSFCKYQEIIHYNKTLTYFPTAQQVSSLTGTSPSESVLCFQSLKSTLGGLRIARHYQKIPLTSESKIFCYWKCLVSISISIDLSEFLLTYYNFYWSITISIDLSEFLLVYQYLHWSISISIDKSLFLWSITISMIYHYFYWSITISITVSIDLCFNLCFYLSCGDPRTKGVTRP